MLWCYTTLYMPNKILKAIRLPSETIEGVERIANTKHLTFSAVVRSCLIDMVDANTKERQTEVQK